MKSENLPEKIDENLIHEIRGMQVMLDSDVLFFFKSEKQNRKIKNLNRFHNIFYIKINSVEFKILTLQNASAE